MKPLTSTEPNIEGYELLAQMSSGGMGQVLLARRMAAHGFEKLFAIKTIRADLARNERVRAMFLDEARLAGRLAHPGIAQVVDFGESDGTLFMVMELVVGLPISGITHGKLPRLSIRAACELIADVCRALHSAHDAKSSAGEPLGVVHRDVSPQNVLLTFDGSVKVIDFGVAKVRDRLTPTTRAGQIKGKPSYMSPEQLNDVGVDRRTDVFASATLLHELLTGERLFMRGNVGATMNAVLAGEIRPPSHLNPEVPPQLDALVMQGLARKVDERWSTALDMAQALDHVVNTAPGVSLETYALDHLGPLRESMERQIRDYVEGQQPDVVDGRREDEATMAPEAWPPSEPNHAYRTPTDFPETQQALRRPTDPVPSADVSTSTRDVIAAGVGKPRRWIPPVAVVGLLVAAGVVFLLPTIRSRLRPTGPVTATAVEPAPNPNPDPASAPAPQSETSAAETEPDPPPRPRKGTRSRPGRRARPAPEPELVTRAAVEANAPVGRGALTAFADPFARVHVDDRYVGDTPLMGYELAAGKHEVKLISPDTGTVRVQRTVTIRADAVTTVKAN